MSYKVAVVGATGNVGREMLNVLVRARISRTAKSWRWPRRARSAPKSRSATACSRSRRSTITISRAPTSCLMSAGGKVSKEWSPKIAAAGRARDRQFQRLAHGPRRAAGRARGERRRAEPASRRASSPIRTARPSSSSSRSSRCNDEAKIKRVVVSTYQSVSGAGKEAMDELFRQTRAVFVADPIEDEHLHQADRLQRDPADRRLPRLRLHQGRMEDDGRDAEDPRSRHPAHRAPACACRCSSATREVGHRRIRAPDHRGRARASFCARRRACSSSTSARTAATSRRSNAPARTRPSSAASARTRRSSMACRMWVVSRQSAQGRGAQRGADRRMPDQPQAAEEGGVTQDDFAALVARFGAAATAGDGKALAACFTEDGVYHDYIYGPHRGPRRRSRTCWRISSIATRRNMTGRSSIRSCTATSAMRARCRASSPRSRSSRARKS